LRRGEAWVASLSPFGGVHHDPRGWPPGPMHLGTGGAGADLVHDAHCVDDGDSEALPAGGGLAIEPEVVGGGDV
jgi:hypothetical protein